MIRSGCIIHPLVLLILLIIGGCGGGTTGTGDVRTTRIEGVLTGSDNLPVPNIEVVILESGEATVTGSEGNFTLVSELRDTTATLLFQLPGGDSQIPIDNIPLEPSVITITVQTNDEKNSIIVENISVEVIGEAPTPTPAAVNPGSPISSTPTPIPTRKSIFKGVVLFSDGVTVEGAKITLLHTGKGDVTDLTGKFSIDLKEHRPKETIEIVYQSSRGQVSISGLPEDKAVVVNMTLRLSLHSDSKNNPSTSNLDFDIAKDSISIKPR